MIGCELPFPAPGRLVLALLCLLALALPSPALAQGRDPILVPDVSEHDIVLRQGFTGADLLLFGTPRCSIRRAGARVTGTRWWWG